MAGGDRKHPAHLRLNGGDGIIEGAVAQLTVAVVPRRPDSPVGPQPQAVGSSGGNRDYIPDLCPDRGLDAAVELRRAVAQLPITVCALAPARSVCAQGK